MSTQPDCPNCKQPLTGNANYCPNCGKALLGQARLTTEQSTGTLPDLLKQYDTMASNYIALASGIISFYAAGIFAGKNTGGNVLIAVVYLFPLVLILGVILSAIRVFYPRGYLTENTFQQIIVGKERRLALCRWLFFAAFAAMIAALLIYLIRPA